MFNRFSLRFLLIVSSLVIALTVACSSSQKAVPPTSSKPSSSTAPSSTTSAKPTTTSSAGDPWAKNMADWEKTTYEAAKKEGKVVLYEPEPKEFTDALAQVFSKKYPGVELVVQFGRGADLGNKVTTEQKAGQVIGDVFITGLSVLRPMVAAGYIEDFVPMAISEPGIKWLINPLREKDYFPGKAVPMLYSFSNYGMIINTKAVPSDKEPKSWKDLLDPSWKGKIITQDPRLTGGSNRTWFWMRKLYGESFWQSLAAQGVAVDTSYDVVARAAATGQYAIALGVSPREFAGLEGTSTKFIMAQEGAPLVEMSIIMIKGAPHPNAARLLVNAFFSREAQDVVGEFAGKTPNRVGSKLKNQVQNLDGVKLLTTTVQEDTVEVQQAAQDLKKYLK